MSGDGRKGVDNVQQQCNAAAALEQKMRPRPILYQWGSLSILGGQPVRVLQGGVGGGGVIGGYDLYAALVGLPAQLVLILAENRHKARPHVACTNTLGVHLLYDCVCHALCNIPHLLIIEHTQVIIP